MPPTRREQLELDELLSDIYLGIETLPDRSTVANSAAPTFSSTNNFSSNNFAASTTGGPNSSRPTNTNTDNYNYNHQHSAEANSRAEASDNQLRQRQQQQAHSLASIVSSSAPNTNTARRVRIIEPAEKRAKSKERGPVKYINTNKLIYHQERNPDDEYEIKIERKPNKRLERKECSGNNNNDDDDDYNDQANDYSDDELDGVTRVQYYHTTWLDRQLGRASKRRNSKELTERQVKEKAMIEELKRNLKNGAITLRQSFRGKRVGQANKSNGTNNNHSNKFTESFDDQYLLAADERVKNKAKNKAVSSYRVIGSGLATLPRNYQQQSSQARERQQQARPVEEQKTLYPFDSRYEPVVEAGGQPERRPIRSQVSEASKSAGDQLKREKSNTLQATPKQTNSSIAPIHAKSSFTETMQTKPIVDSASNYSRTLPHNFNHNHLAGDRKRQQHQLLQSHYRSGSNLSASPRPFQQQAAPVSSALVHHSSTMQRTSDGQCNSPKQVDFNTRPNYGTLPARSPSRQQPAQGVLRNQNLQQQPARTEENTISSIPSATEVVRQALSRSASQASLNQLNKTINLLPSSPSPYPHSHPAQSPASPSQQLRAATPSLSPSPVQCNLPASQRAANFYNQNQTQIHNQNQNSRPQQQQVYANPHASLMQQRLDEQTRRSRNQSSIREFNELDSLLRSLSPSLNVQHTKQPVANAAPINQHSAGAHIRPGFNSQPAQPAFGYGYNQPVLARPANNSAALYAKVQKPNEPSQQAGYLQRNYQQVGNQSDPFTIDVTSRKGNDENCLEREEISEFEPPIELLPSMEDYQNISRLNPVKNHFWYKPNMSRDRAIELLKDKPQGTFIVRDSTSFRGAFGLAVKVSKLPKNVMNNSALRNTSDPSAELIRHFLIEPTSSGVRLKGYANEPIFGSLPALIYQHSLVQLALPCKLVIPRADIEDINFNYKQKQFYDEFLASKEQAKHAAYIDTTSPNGGYRKYPGDVYVHNEHRIIFE